MADEEMIKLNLPYRELVWGLLIAYLISFPLGQLTRIPIVAYDIHLYLSDLIVGCIAVIGLLLKNKEFPPFFSKIIFLFFAGCFSLLVAASQFSLSQLAVGFLYLFRVGAYILFYCSLWNTLSENHLGYINKALVGVGTAVSVLGWVQYFLFPDLGKLTCLGWDPHLYRIAGTFLDPGFTAIIIVFTILLVTDRIIKRTRIAWLVLWVFLFTSLAFTYSRSGYIALFAGMSVFTWFRRDIRILILTAALLVLTIFFLPRPGGEGVKLERTSSTFARVQSWKNAMVVFGKNPVFGTGFNMYRYAQGKYGLLDEQLLIPNNGGAGSDSSLLFILATTGVIGGLFTINLVYFLLKTIKSPVVLVTCAALFVHSLFLNSLFYPWVMGWTAILLATTDKKSP